ncbi:NFACT family protein, partial [Candidatus Latescibacterota bacterium]
YNIFLEFNGENALKLSCVPDMPYMHLIGKKYIPQKKSISWHNTFFSGKILEDISITHGDRIVIFHFNSDIRLIFEMTGRHSNIIIIGSDNIIVGAVRKVTNKESGIREIRSGVHYYPPPARDFPDLAWVSFQSFVRQLKASKEPIIETLRNKFCAGSNYFALETLSRASINQDEISANLNTETLSTLPKTMAELTSEIENGGSGATLIFGNDNLPKDVFPVKMTAGELLIEYEDMLETAIQKYAREREIGLEQRSIRNFILGVLNREEKSIHSTIRKVERERGKKTDPEKFERMGNTILANVHVIKKGMKSAELTDPYSEKIEIDLDRTMDAPSNANRFFKRAKKIRAAAKLAEERLSNLKARLEKISSERDNVAITDEIKSLKAIAKKYKRSQLSSAVPADDEKFPRRFKSVSGLEIIVGRNDRENDELIRWANKNDFWLHAQNIGGSHVILRSPGKQSPDHQSVEHAASIAAYYSKAKTSAIVPVACTQLKYVVKRKGQGPGKVTYSREKVLFVEPVLTKQGK